MSKSNNSTVMIDGKEFDVADLEYLKNLLDSIDLRPIPSKIDTTSSLIHQPLTRALNPSLIDEYSVKYAPGVKERVEPSRRLKKQKTKKGGSKRNKNITRNTSRTRSRVRTKARTRSRSKARTKVRTKVRTTDRSRTRTRERVRARSRMRKLKQKYRFKKQQLQQQQLPDLFRNI